MLRTTTSLATLAIGYGLMTRLLHLTVDGQGTTAPVVPDPGEDGGGPAATAQTLRPPSPRPVPPEQQDPPDRSTGTPPDLPKDPPPHSWQVQVRTAAAQCRADLTGHAQTGSHDELVPLVEQHLGRALELTTERVPVRHRYSGRSVESAWAHVHHARALLPLVLDRTALRSELMHARSLTRRYLSSHDDRRKAVEDDDLAKRLTGVPADDKKQHEDADRHVVSGAVMAAYDVNDRRFAALRGWRNRLYVLTALSAVVTVGLLLSSDVRNGLLPLGSLPAIAATASAPAVPVQAVNAVMVALIGSLGGLLTALAAVRGAGPSTSAYSLTPALSALKLPTGALTALLGIMLIQSDTVPGLQPLTAVGAVAAASLLFGASQELLTRLIDVRARAVETAAVKGSTVEDTASGVP